MQYKQLLTDVRQAKLHTQTHTHTHTREHVAKLKLSGTALVEVNTVGKSNSELQAIRQPSAARSYTAADQLPLTGFDFTQLMYLSPMTRCTETDYSFPLVPYHMHNALYLNNYIGYIYIYIYGN